MRARAPFVLAILLLVELAGASLACRRRSGRGETPSPTASGPPTMDAAVAAGLNALRHVQDVVAAHHDRLAAQRGVATISAVGDALGARVRIELCAEEAREGLVVGSLGVPFEVAVGPGGTTARGALCGCAQGGKYYEAGETYPVDCNTCRCVGANQSADCTMKACGGSGAGTAGAPDAAISLPDAATPPGLTSSGPARGGGKEPPRLACSKDADCTVSCAGQSGGCCPPCSCDTVSTRAWSSWQLAADQRERERRCAGAGRCVRSCAQPRTRTIAHCRNQRCVGEQVPAP